MELVTVATAAKLLGRDERTVRRWITNKILPAEQGVNGRTLVDVDDVTNLKDRLEREEDNRLRKQAQPDTAGLLATIAGMQKQIDGLQEQIDTLKEIRAGPATLWPDISARPPQARPVRPVYTGQVQPAPQELPAGSVHMRDFAEAHDIERSSFHAHLTKGLRGDVPITHTAIPKPGRLLKDGTPEMDRWLTPDQQIAAAAYWTRHRTPWLHCTRPGCVVCDNQAQEYPTHINTEKEQEDDKPPQE